MLHPCKRVSSLIANRRLPSLKKSRNASSTGCEGHGTPQCEQILARIGNGPRRPADQREPFTSKILPPYLRKTRSIDELIPWLYLKGVSTGDFSEALQALLGPDAPGLSATTVTRLKTAWEGDYEAWRTRSLLGKEYVYVWADGSASWCSLEPPATGGLIIPPKLAIGDGALGFWAALREVYPSTREQRCWVHLRTTNPIESTFATVRLRTRRTKGCGSRVACLTMVFKLVQCAERRWRALNGSALIPEVSEGCAMKPPDPRCDTQHLTISRGANTTVCRAGRVRSRPVGG